jgi:hypothetical protein
MVKLPLTNTLSPDDVQDTMRPTGESSAGTPPTNDFTNPDAPPAALPATGCTDCRCSDKVTFTVEPLDPLVDPDQDPAVAAAVAQAVLCVRRRIRLERELATAQEAETKAVEAVAEREMILLRQQAAGNEADAAGTTRASDADDDDPEPLPTDAPAPEWQSQSVLTLVSHNLSRSTCLTLEKRGYNTLGKLTEMVITNGCLSLRGFGPQRATKVHNALRAFVEAHNSCDMPIPSICGPGVTSPTPSPTPPEAPPPAPEDPPFDTDNGSDTDDSDTDDNNHPDTPTGWGA